MREDQTCDGKGVVHVVVSHLQERHEDSVYVHDKQEFNPDAVCELLVD